MDYRELAGNSVSLLGYVAFFGLVYVGLHQLGSTLAVQSLVGVPHAAFKRIVKQVVKKVFSKNHR